MPLPDFVLVEKTAFKSLFMDSDVHHKIASKIYERIIDFEQEIWTSSVTLVEILDDVYRQLGQEEASKAAESILNNVHIYWIDNTVLDDVLHLIGQSQPKKIILEDGITMIIAKRLRAYIFTFNDFFSEFGLPVVSKP